MPEHQTTARFPSLLTRRSLFRTAGVTGVAAASGLLITSPASALSTLGVQTALWGLYYYDGLRDGDLGPKSNTAIRQFQADRALVVDGDAGAITRAELVSVVSEVQAHVSVSEDGDYGAKTVAAVEEFQRGESDLVVDGRAGAKTMALMGLVRTVPGGGNDLNPDLVLAQWNTEISRSQVIDRAMFWAQDKRPYSMGESSPGPEPAKLWRTDCSGFVSMAWGTFPADKEIGFTTGMLHPDAGHGVTRAIEKSELEPGDILLITPEENGKEVGHVGIFEKWADAARTTWVILEQAYSTEGTARRTIGYPYSPSPSGSKYKPYRYTRIAD
ncbi:peptidoglycan-binding protein [Brachybacterium sp. FME24]|uniref:peptidoglycan-binding protein n=1 Tax=Brachybacterium sp. FME24 TaxID=2742605 RepID=UPI0018682979|nr:peptidoglycan-binding protein [Brachybacterium sp. FME24]